MADLTPDDVLDLIRGIESGRASAVDHPLVSSDGERPPHIVWGIGSGQPQAVGATAHGLEFRTGEYWAEGWGDLEPTDDPWIIEGVERNAAALRQSMELAARRQTERAARETTAKASTVDLVITYLEAPSPERFEQTLSKVALWIDHRDEDDAVVAGVARKLRTGMIKVTETDGTSLTITGPGGVRTITPMNRDTTLRAIAASLGPEIELRHWIGGPPADTVAVLVLTEQERLAIIAARSKRALDAQFRRIHPRSKIFV